MDTHEIVPDVIDTVPKSELRVEFGNHSLNLGNLLTIEQVRHPPTKISWEFNPNKYYTLCFTGKANVKLHLNSRFMTFHGYSELALYYQLSLIQKLKKKYYLYLVICKRSI